jgi:NAD/NADP transhydrogenase alpha subunit
MNRGIVKAVALVAVVSMGAPAFPADGPVVDAGARVRIKTDTVSMQCASTESPCDSSLDKGTLVGQVVSVDEKSGAVTVAVDSRRSRDGLATVRLNDIRRLDVWRQDRTVRSSQALPMAITGVVLGGLIGGVIGRAGAESHDTMLSGMTTAGGAAEGALLVGATLGLIGLAFTHTKRSEGWEEVRVHRSRVLLGVAPAPHRGAQVAVAVHF